MNEKSRDSTDKEFTVVYGVEICEKCFGSINDTSLGTQYGTDTRVLVMKMDADMIMIIGK